MIQAALVDSVLLSPDASRHASKLSFFLMVREETHHQKGGGSKPTGGHY